MEMLELPEVGRSQEGYFWYWCQRETSPANALFSDFWLPELSDNTFLLLCATGLWDLVMAALGREHTVNRPFLGGFCILLLNV